MSEIDEQLFFSIDERSNIVDLSEKGRSFLSSNNDDFIIPDLGEVYHNLERGNLSDKDIAMEKEKAQSSQLQTSTTTTHAGKVREGNRVEYTQSKVGIMLKMTDKTSGAIVWSNSYWYSGLELQRTIDLCIKSSVLQIKKLFQ